jgi:hypothetical protein
VLSAHYHTTTPLAAPTASAPSLSSQTISKPLTGMLLDKTIQVATQSIRLHAHICCHKRPPNQFIVGSNLIYRAPQQNYYCVGAHFQIGFLCSCGALLRPPSCSLLVNTACFNHQNSADSKIEKLACLSAGHICLILSRLRLKRRAQLSKHPPNTQDLLGTLCRGHFFTMKPQW